ncbi:MAG: YARHG domain-containing protein [Deltaproteobacteria bacterium]|nr:YARHG domain-containing protein [Deltaproteobacteria bacterium]
MNRNSASFFLAVTLPFLFLAGSVKEICADEILDNDKVPYYYNALIDDSDLKDKSLRELSIMRNTIFAMAGNVFHKKWLHDYFNTQWWYDATGLDHSKLSDMDYKNARKIAKREATIPKEELQRRLAMLRKFKEAGKWNSRFDIELGLLMSALGEPVDWDPSAARRSPLEDYRLLDKLINVESIRNLSGRDLRILRNMIFARHGRPFVSEILQEHFGRMYWYKADPNYSDKKLTDIDRKNIKIVLSVEDEHGGSLTEGQHRAEKEAEERRHWYVAA